MNFQEWYRDYEPTYFPSKETIAQDAWSACKDEVMRVILYSGQDINKELVEEIRKL